MENIKFQIKEPKRNANGKILTIIAEFCKNWVLFRRKADLEYLLIEPLSEKGYTVKYSVIPFSFRIPVDYSIFKVKDGEKIKIFSNRNANKKQNEQFLFQHSCNLSHRSISWQESWHGPAYLA